MIPTVDANERTGSFTRSYETLLRHGFVVKVAPQGDGHESVTHTSTTSTTLQVEGLSQRARDLSPNGPNCSGIGYPRRRVTWDLSCSGTGGFVPLPFKKEGMDKVPSSSPPPPLFHNQKSSRTSPSSSVAPKKSHQALNIQRRSTVAVVDVEETTALQRGRDNKREPHASVEVDSSCDATMTHRRQSSATTVGLSKRFDVSCPVEGEKLEINDAAHHKCNGYRNDYKLGDFARSFTDMIQESSLERATQAVEALQIHDFAWVKRSDGLFTYAILAYRSISPLIEGSSTHSLSDKSLNEMNDEEYFYFVVDNIGSTKMVPKSRWYSNVRIVKPMI